MQTNRKQKQPEKMNLFLTFMGTLCLCLSLTPTANGFATFKHQDGERGYRVLIQHVHAESWKVGYRLSGDCEAGEKDDDKKLETAITASLQAWLQPLREMKLPRPIVDKFIYSRQSDIQKIDWNRWGNFALADWENLGARLLKSEGLDVRVTFQCEGKENKALISTAPPEVYIGSAVITPITADKLTHELGHAFGLADTYVGRGEVKVSVSKGGIRATIGVQPASVMSGHLHFFRPLPLTNDDSNGIIWLYKHYHEGLPIDNCLFPDYEFERDPDGCRPKYPLIFEVKRGAVITTNAITEHDPNIDVNEQDETGFTALHYAAMEGYSDIVKALVAEEDLDVNIKDAQGNTALFYAAKAWNADIENLIRTHASFDPSLHQTLVKISGDAQEGTVGTLLASPFIVEARDIRGQPLPDTVVTWTIDGGEGMLAPLTATTDAEGRARTTLALGWTPGTAIIRATAEAIQSEVVFTATATELSAQIAPEDVNADGAVNVDDLLLVASSFGTVSVPDVMPNTDVNGDGEVNTEDVLLVLAALEGAAAAPTTNASWVATSLQHWIAEVKRRDTRNARLQRGLLVLEQLLPKVLPRQTILLLNYPNPFNPETWIPYQLAEPTEVRIDIYAMDGVLVRTLALGHQTAGFYTDRERAAYWDGKNEVGVPVASGIYFYKLSAGNFTATRKMVIRR